MTPNKTWRIVIEKHGPDFDVTYFEERPGNISDQHLFRYSSWDLVQEKLAKDKIDYKFSPTIKDLLDNMIKKRALLKDS